MPPAPIPQVKRGERKHAQVALAVVCQHHWSMQALYASIRLLAIWGFESLDRCQVLSSPEAIGGPRASA